MKMDICAEKNCHSTNNGQDDAVHPIYDPTMVFECKYEIDSLANFLSLGNQYYKNTGDNSFVTDKWISALDNVMTVIEQQQSGTFSASGGMNDMVYTFQRRTNAGVRMKSNLLIYF